MVPGLGAQRIWTLLKIAGHPQEIFRMAKPRLQGVPGIGPSTAKAITGFNRWPEVDRIIDTTRRTGSRIITYRHPDYPPLLKQIYDPPILFWIKGELAALSQPGISVVGTRKATAYGKQAAETITRSLVEQGLAIFSGLALGIDTVAHRTTVAGGGTTVAVLGSGIDWIYPGSNRRLAADIIDGGGAVISELPPGSKPDAGNFPMRNRLVSGLSLGTLVIESAFEGGSMITARSALDQNREVFVVPHSMEQPQGVGCNHLIQSGQGKLVTSADDILEEVSIHIQDRHRPETPISRTWQERDLDDRARTICRLLESQSLHIDQLSQQLQQPASVLLPTLLELEMEGIVRQTAGKVFRLV